MQIDEISTLRSPEIALVILCSRVFIRTATYDELETFIQTHDINWPRVYQLCTVHRIRPVVFRVLSIAHVPAPILRPFHDYCYAFSVFAFDRQMEALRVQQLLRSNHIPVRMYKGLDFSLSAYNGDISMREFTDIDLIIQEKNIGAVVEVMEADGYHCKGIAYFRRYPKRFLASQKDICFEKRCPRGGVFSFEFHYRPVKYIMDLTFSFEDILGKDLFSGAIMHEQYYLLMLLNHGGSDLFPDIRSLLDMAMVSPGKVPLALQRFERLWQLLSVRLLGYSFEPVPDLAMKSTADQLAKRLLSPTPQLLNSKKTFLIKVRMHMRFRAYRREKMRILIKALRFLMLPNENDFEGRRLPFFYLYYFTKPFRLLKRKSSS